MLKIGENLPDIQLPNQDGEMISLHSFKGKNPLVIYFYPKNNTPGCTIEACSFRDSYEDFLSLGAVVIGISGDTVASHKSVAEKRKLPFILLSDSNREAERAFGVERNLFGLLPGRVTFIADQHGRIYRYFFISYQTKSTYYSCTKNRSRKPFSPSYSSLSTSAGLSMEALTEW